MFLTHCRPSLYNNKFCHFELANTMTNAIGFMEFIVSYDLEVMTAIRGIIKH